jgi:transcription antitermination factor NusG
MRILVIDEPTIDKQKLIDTINKHKLSNGIIFVEMEPDDALSTKIIETFQQMNDLSDKTIIINVNDSTINQLMAPAIASAVAANHELHIDHGEHIAAVNRQDTCINEPLDMNAIIKSLHISGSMYKPLVKPKHKRIKSSIQIPEYRSSGPVLASKKKRKK